MALDMYIVPGSPNCKKLETVHSLFPFAFVPGISLSVVILAFRMWFGSSTATLYTVYLICFSNFGNTRLNN